MSKLSSTLLDYQRRAVTRGLQLKSCFLIMPMGSGKTRTSLSIIERRHRRAQVYRVVVVCQKTLKEQWEAEIRKWLPYARVIQDPKQNTGEKLSFLVVSYEWIRERMKLIRKCDFDMIVADESHKLKNRSSKQSRRMWLIGKGIKHRLALTGTPTEGNELDLWAQVRYVDERVFGSSWADFADRWTRSYGFMGKKKKLKKHLVKTFLDKVASVSFIVTDKEALGLPPIQDIDIPVRLEGKQEKAYRQMEQDLVVKLRGDQVLAKAEMVATQLIRLQQISGGFLPDEDGTLHHLGNAKLNALGDLLESHPQPILIYARYLPEIAAIEVVGKKLGREVSIVTGDRKVGTHKKFDMLVCQVGIVAGLDGMQEVTETGVFYSKGFSRIQYEQARSRLRRKGQRKKVKFFDIFSLFTVDIDLMEALKGKHDVNEGVVKHLLKRMRQHHGEEREAGIRR